MKKASNGYYGFTIVELLIVIVVIGVLAAITTNVFNGIQKRAQDTQVIAHVNQWSKIINSYATSIVRYGTGGFYDMRGLILRTNDSKVRNYKITYSLQQEKCPAGDGIGYQESDDGRGISGTSPPGLYGRKKLCVRNLTDL
ncbi:MAG: type II secretion system protein [Chloroflexi bacterium]|nr:MAG: type II secretion system protein [Chloroflexota bacterium]